MLDLPKELSEMFDPTKGKAGFNCSLTGRQAGGIGRGVSLKSLGITLKTSLV